MNASWHLTDDEWNLTETIPQTLSEIEGDPLDPAAMEAVLTAMEGCSVRFFWFLDDGGGERFGYERNGREWHYRLRAVRNHPVMGGRLFDQMERTDRGELSSAETPAGTCTLTRSGDRYEMRGPSGSHSLAVAHTDSARLKTHWAGFIEINRRRVLRRGQLPLMTDNELTILDAVRHQQSAPESDEGEEADPDAVTALVRRGFLDPQGRDCDGTFRYTLTDIGDAASPCSCWVCADDEVSS